MAEATSTSWKTEKERLAKSAMASFAGVKFVPSHLRTCPVSGATVVVSTSPISSMEAIASGV